MESLSAANTSKHDTPHHNTALSNALTLFLSSLIMSSCSISLVSVSSNARFSSIFSMMAKSSTSPNISSDICPNKSKCS
nr:hypothetical protein [Psittaciform parvoviridae sp.]